MDEIFFTWYKSQFRCSKVKWAFLHGKAPHVSTITREFFEHKRFRRDKIMKWLSSPDLNPIENLWSLVKIIVNNIVGKQIYGKKLKLQFWK